MVSTDDGRHNPAIYGKFLEVLSKAKSQTVPPHRSTNDAIDLQSGYNLPNEQIHNLSESELRMFKA